MILDDLRWLGRRNAPLRLGLRQNLQQLIVGQEVETREGGASGLDLSFCADICRMFSCNWVKHLIESMD